MVSGTKLFIDRLKCAIFCNKPFELVNHVENLEDGVFGMVQCPKCGQKYAIFNKKNAS